MGYNSEAFGIDTKGLARDKIASSSLDGCQPNKALQPTPSALPGVK